MTMPTTKVKPRILCVDDEPLVLAGIEDMLGRAFEIHTAESGAIALEAIRTEAPFAVIMSDMRMPVMDGATFLAEARRLSPSSTRLLLTGQADLAAAVRAVNEAQLFRFLSKPIEPDALEAVMRDAVEQNRLDTAERVLLDETLNQSVRMMLDVVDLVSAGPPRASNRIHEIARFLAEQTRHDAVWAVEAAAMLTEVSDAAIGDPNGGETSNRYQTAATLVEDVPRMTNVVDLLLAAAREEQAGAIVRVASALAHELSGGASLRSIVDRLERDGVGDAALWEAARSVPVLEHKSTTIDATLRTIRPGMRTAGPISATNGTMILGADREITHAVMARLRTMADGIGIEEPFLVWS